MTVTTEMVKELRARTGAGIMDCRKTLESTGGDMEKAAELLRAKGLAAAAKRAGRAASDGLIESYIHPGSRLGALVEVNCETDFVARTEEFRVLAREIAMQVAAAAPTYIAREDVPAAAAEQQRALLTSEAKGASEAEIEARLSRWFEEVVLLEQPYIRDAGKRVVDVVNDTVARLGENVRIRRFARFRLGE